MGGSWMRDVPWTSLAVGVCAVALLSLIWLRPAMAARSLASVRSPASSAAIGSVALFYGESVPVEDLTRFDTVVVEPDSGFDPRLHSAHVPHMPHGTQWFAYVSVGEITRERRYYAQVPKAWLIGSNDAWSSTVVDQTASGWPKFFVDHVIAPLWARGYRGFFFDTLDSYQLVSKTADQRAQQEAGLIAVIRAVKRRYPNARLIFNRGFEILPQVHDDVDAVAFESLFGKWDQGNQRYDEVPQNDRDWLLGQAGTIRERYRLPVISIDYCAPGDDLRSRSIVQKIDAAGLVPYVTDGALRTVGMGAGGALR